MIIFGLILVVAGVITAIPILTTIGVLLIFAGVVLTILGAVGRGVGGRKTYY